MLTVLEEEEKYAIMISNHNIMYECVNKPLHLVILYSIIICIMRSVNGQTVGQLAACCLWFDSGPETRLHVEDTSGKNHGVG